MTSRSDTLEDADGPPTRGASARERALRFNRCFIGLCVAALLAVLLLPI